MCKPTGKNANPHHDLNSGPLFIMTNALTTELQGPAKRPVGNWQINHLTYTCQLMLQTSNFWCFVFFLTLPQGITIIIIYYYYYYYFFFERHHAGNTNWSKLTDTSRRMMKTTFRPESPGLLQVKWKPCASQLEKIPTPTRTWTRDLCLSWPTL